MIKKFYKIQKKKSPKRGDIIDGTDFGVPFVGIVLEIVKIEDCEHYSNFVIVSLDYIFTNRTWKKNTWNWNTNYSKIFIFGKNNEDK